MRLDLFALQSMDDTTRRIMLQYLIKVADVSDQLLFDTAMECLPKDKEILMTVEDRILQRGVKQGIERGIEQGIEQGKIEMAKGMLLSGIDEQLILNISGLSHMDLLEIRRSIQH
jgi:predicted transposase/invertase (TIGR01784 family)